MNLHYQKYKVLITKSVKKYRKLHPKKVKEWNKTYLERLKKDPIRLKKHNEMHMKEYRKYNPIIKNSGKGNGWEVVRLKALQRDSFICQRCGVEATEVHHKDGTGSNNFWKERNNKLDNLISVCHKCNIQLDLELWGTTNFNKGKWKKDVERNNMILELSKKFSQSEISRKLGITRQRVNQIIKREAVDK
jgi:hypothetical protein